MAAFRLRNALPVCLFTFGLQPHRYCSTTLKLSVKDILKSQPVGNFIRVKGWIRALRHQKDNTFADLSDGSCFGRLQIVLKSDEMPRDLSYGCSVDVIGELVKSQHSGQPVELRSHSLTVCGACDLECYPIPPRKSLPLDYLRQFLHLRPRTKLFSSILRARNAATYAFHQYFQNQDFIFIHTPIITTNDCEGAGETFIVQTNQPPNNIGEDKKIVESHFFDKKTFLTVSGQLHLEAVASSLSNVYTLGPTFRAENSRSRHHLSEFFMLEAEMAFCADLDVLLKFIEDMIKFVTKTVLDQSSEDIEFLHKKAQHKMDVHNILDKQFIRMSYSEAIEILQRLENDAQPIHWGQDLNKQQELRLVKHCNGNPIFLTEFPVALKPFYMKVSETNPETADAVDLIVSGVGEMCGGSIREHRLETLQQKLDLIKIGEGLNWYLDLRRYGTCPHAGFGLGFDRYIQYILGLANIKDAIPFPRWTHHCSL